MIRNLRIFSSATAALALVVSLSVTALPASAGSSPTLTATPSTGLTNNQEVTVTGSGWPANQSYYMVECLRSATGESGCSISELVPVSSDSAGNIPPTQFKVYTGSVGGGDCGSTQSTLDNCAISVGSPTPGSASAVANISFAGSTPTTTTTAAKTVTSTTAKSVTTTTVKPKTKTITCVKGKATKKVTAVNPKCPSGYKLK